MAASPAQPSAVRGRGSAASSLRARSRRAAPSPRVGRRAEPDALPLGALPAQPLDEDRVERRAPPAGRSARSAAGSSGSPTCRSISRIACSLAPGWRHQFRSKARMRISRSDSAAISPSLLPIPARVKPSIGGSEGPATCPTSGDPSVVRSPFVATFDCLTFLTDYGLDDGFVAACHGVAARIAPGVRIIDITHLVPPGDVRRGAAVLAQTLPYLPPAVHVAVVDPGVGTHAARHRGGRRATPSWSGPTTACCPGRSRRWAGPRRAFQLTNGELWLHPVSPDLPRPGHFHRRSPRIWPRAPTSPRSGTEIDVGRSGDPARTDQPGA